MDEQILFVWLAPGKPTGGECNDGRTILPVGTAGARGIETCDPSPHHRRGFVSPCLSFSVATLSPAPVVQVARWTILTNRRTKG